MQHKLASNRYGTLNARERLTLVLEATVREDRAEVRCLWDTAPMHLYKAVDQQFDAGHAALRVVTYVIGYFLNEKIGRIRMGLSLAKGSSGLVRAIAAEEAGCLDELVRHELDGDPAEEPPAALAQVDEATAEMRGGLEDMHRILCQRVVMEAAEIMAGFGQFTRKLVDLDGIIVFRALLPTLAKDVEKLGILTKEPKAEDVREWEKLCSHFWNREMSLHGPQDGNRNGQNK